MRIILLTPGTGSFYCGTCMRDNALAVALRKQGHDALLVPLYLPPTLDEAIASADAPVFYGGINVYLQQQSALFRKTPRWLDKLLDAPGLLKSAGKRAGMTQARDLGPMTLSMLRGEDGNQVKELERLVEWLASEKPDAVCLSNALLMGMGRRIKQATGARLACTLQGEDGFLDALPPADSKASWETVAERAQDFDAFIAVSHYHADLMTKRANLPSERVHVVYNGIALDGYPTAPTPPKTPTVGYLARMCAPKGLATLVEAFLLLGKRMPTARLKIGGAQTTGDVAYVASLQAKITAAGLSERVSFHPNLTRDEKIAFLQSLSVLSVPATYGESFGLYVIEALAAGVPVVQPRHAVFPELLSATGGGVLCEPDNPQALAEALEDVLSDPPRAVTLGAAGQKNVREHFSVEVMARAVAAVLQQGNSSHTHLRVV